MTSIFNSEAVPQGLEIGKDVLKKVLLGCGLAGTVATYVYAVVSRNPAESFNTLRQFGPGFVLGVLGIVLVYSLLSSIGKVFVMQTAKLADGVQSLSIEVGKIAERDDRQAEELRRQTAFNGQQSERILELLHEQAKQLQVIDSKLDHPIQGERL